MCIRDRGWSDDEVMAHVPSDPFLMYGFDQKSLHLWHDSNEAVSFKIEVDVVGNGQFKIYETKTVGSGEYMHYEFPESFSARWVRVTANKNCKATAWFIYN